MKWLIAKELHVREVRLKAKCDILTLGGKRNFTRPALFAMENPKMLG
jgi:hypothetical protein